MGFNVSFRTVRWSRIVVVQVKRSESVLGCGRRAQVLGGTGASLFAAQTNRFRLQSPPALGVRDQCSAAVGRNPSQTSCLDFPVWYTASSKKPGTDILSAACVVKRKLSLNLSQQTQCFRVNTCTVKKRLATHVYKKKYYKTPKMLSNSCPITMLFTSTYKIMPTTDTIQ